MATSIVRHAPDPTAPRSAKWPAVEHAHLKKEPCCRGCGSAHDLNVHHVQPFHLYPKLELVDSNLVTLCRECHLVFGHFHNWSSWNVSVRADADSYRQRVKKRPA